MTEHYFKGSFGEERAEGSLFRALHSVPSKIGMPPGKRAHWHWSKPDRAWRLMKDTFHLGVFVKVTLIDSMLSYCIIFCILVMAVDYFCCICLY